MTASQPDDQVADADVSREAASPEASSPDAETTLDEAQLRERVAELETLLEEERSRHARAVADYQNLRRRSAEERLEQTRLVTKALVFNYLPVLDDLRRALDAVEGHPEIAQHPWVEGVRMAQRKFWGVLESSGVREIEAEGRDFDPELHEAVAFQAGPEGRVIAVVQSGYTLDGQVIRPAGTLVGNGEDAAQREGDGGAARTEPPFGAQAGTLGGNLDHSLDDKPEDDLDDGNR